MRVFVSRLLILCLVLGPLNVSAAPYIEFVEFKDAKIKDAARILSTMTGANIAVTKEASEETASLLLQKTELKYAIDMLSRVAGLWYRYNKAGNSYIIMTEKQYQDDIVVYRDDVIKTFTLKHQNVNSTAVTIQSLFGDRVKLTLQKDNDDFLGLELDVADTNEATTVDDNRERRVADVDIQELDRKNLAEDIQVGLKGQDISAGSLRQIGEAQTLDANAAGRILGARTPIYIATNRIHNLLHVRTSDENAMAEIARLIDESDKPTPQVLLEMKIVRIDVGDSYEQDFDLSFNDALNVSGNFVGTDDSVFHPKIFNPEYIGYEGDETPINEIVRTFSEVQGESGTALGFNGSEGGFYEFFSKYVTAKISLLEKNNQAEVIAKPIMLASNNRPARLFIGSEQVVPVTLETDTRFSSANNNGDRTSSTTTTLETERRKIGNTLILLPSVNADRTVTIDIFQDSSSIEKNGMNFPFFNNQTETLETVPLDSVQESNVKTVVVAKDGKTIALGGMINSQMSDLETVVPVLGEMPLIGELFRSKETVDETSQYVMLITPHVLLSPEESEEKTQKLEEFDYHADKPRQAVDQKFDVSDYIELVRFAASIEQGEDAKQPKGLVAVPLSLSPLSFVFADPEISAWPVSSWQKSGLHVTSIKIKNHSGQTKSIDLSSIPGAWLASAGDQEVSPGGEARVYLLSATPFNQTVAEYNRKGR